MAFCYQFVFHYNWYLTGGTQNIATTKLQKTADANCGGDSEEEDGAAKEGKKKSITAMVDAMMPLSKGKHDDSDEEGPNKKRRRGTPKAKAAPENPQADIFGIQVKSPVMYPKVLFAFTGSSCEETEARIGQSHSGV